MKSGLFLLKLRPQYHVLKPQLYYSNLIIPPQKNICYTCQHLSDHIILKTNMVAAEPTSHPLLNTSCVGATRPQQLSGSLSEQFDVTARSPTTTTQPDRSNIDLPIIPWGLGASQCLYVEVCGRVARSSGDIYTTQTSSHLCPTVSAQLWIRWLKSAIYCFTSWVNSIGKTLERGTFCSDLFFADVWQIKGGWKKKSQMCHCKVPGHRAPAEQLQCSLASLQSLELHWTDELLQNIECQNPKSPTVVQVYLDCDGIQFISFPFVFSTAEWPFQPKDKHFPIKGLVRHFWK